MKKDSNIDLSDIKENELDKTSSFTDLMSRSQRKAHEKSKKNIEKNQIKEVKQESPNEFSISTDKAKLRIKVNDGSNVDEKKDILDKKIVNNKLENEEIKKSYLDDDDFDEEKAKIGLSIFGGLLTLGSIGYYIYLILYTDILLRKKFFIVESVILIFIIFFICINSIGNKKISKLSLVFAYICILAFIALNILIKLNYVK